MGRKAKDITNKHYGLLTAKYRTDKKDGNCYIWHCECDCGGHMDIAINRLEHKEIQSCGCLLHRHIDITGEIFGRLEVIQYAYNKNGKSHWECRCNCEKCTQVIISYGDLTSHKVTSCGCVRSDQMKKMFVAGTNAAKIKNPQLRDTNKSGVTGVSYDKNRKKWSAEITFQGIRYRLGRYEDFDEAVEVRKDTEKKLHTEYLKEFEKSEDKK